VEVDLVDRVTPWGRSAAVLAPALVVVTWSLLVFGSTVRIYEAGLACPDWPMCYGNVIPDLDFQVGLEFGHRVLAGFVSLGFLALGALFAADPGLRRLLVWWTAAAVVLAVQIVLGGLTVLELLAEWTVTSHLVAGNTFCLLLLVLARGVLDNRQERGSISLGERVGAIALLVVVFGQLGLGGLVASSHAGLACGPVWPECAGDSWFPTFQGVVGLQVVHRIGAYTVLAVSIGFVALTRGKGPLGTASLVALGVVLVQVAVGIANVWFRMPIPVTAAHSAVAALLVLTSGWVVYDALRSPVRLPRAHPAAAPARVSP
jgi:cytochrome c oxidase assembly protein subunit 15